MLHDGRHKLKLRETDGTLHASRYSTTDGYAVGRSSKTDLVKKGCDFEPFLILVFVKKFHIVFEKFPKV